MRKLRIFAVLLLWVSSGFAVTNCTRYDSIAQQNKNGVNYVIPNASVQVCPSTATGIPCTPTATVYSDNACSVVIGTATADVNGNFHFYADSSKQYKYQVTGANVALFEVDDLSLPFNPAQPPAISASSYNNVVEADTQVGATADVKLNACIAAVIAAGGGECDARGLKGTQTIAAQVGVGNSAFVPVLLRLPQQAVWNVTITDGVSCGLKQFNKSSIIGTGSGPGGMILQAGSIVTSVDSLLCTDSSPSGGGSYVRAEGFRVYNGVGATFASAAVNWQKLFDNSTLSNMHISDLTNDGLLVYGVCCGSSFAKITSDAGGTGKRPVFIKADSGAINSSISFSDLSADHAGAGFANVEISGVKSAVPTDGTNRAILFNNPYSEFTTGVVSTGFKIVDARDVTFINPEIGVAGGAAGSVGISISQTGANQVRSINVLGYNYEQAGGSTGLVNSITSENLMGSTAYQSFYYYGGTGGSQIVRPWILNDINGFNINNGAGTNIFSIDASGNVSGNKYTSTVATGTAPLVIASTTPVANLTLSQHPQVEYCGATSGGTQACAKTVLTTPFIVQGDVLLNGATTQSITTLPFTNANYSCSGSDLTTAAGIVSFNTYANASVTIQESGGVNTDHLRYICGGN